MIRPLLLALTGLMLAGCASMTPHVEYTVQSYARWVSATGTGEAQASAAPATPQRYRFERLPSRQGSAPADHQDSLEAWTRATLEAMGWAPANADVPAAWTVEVSAGVERMRGPWDEPWGGWRFHGQIMANNGGIFWAPMFVVPMEPSWYRRQVVLVIRSTADGRVAYETRAQHEGRWNDSAALWRTLIEAALAGFPAPPDGVRRIDTELPR